MPIAVVRSSPQITVFVRLALVKLAPPTTAAVRFALVRFAPVKSAPVRLARIITACLRLARTSRDVDMSATLKSMNSSLRFEKLNPAKFANWHCKTLMHKYSFGGTVVSRTVVAGGVAAGGVVSGTVMTGVVVSVTVVSGVAAEEVVATEVDPDESGVFTAQALVETLARINQKIRRFIDLF